MADESKAPEAKKKGGKLPIVVAVVVLLAGGGFFATRAKGGPKAPTKIELGDKEMELEEFLTNMADGTTYIRTKIAVKLRKDFGEAQWKAESGAVRDAVNTVLRSIVPSDIRTTAGLRRLKRNLAEAMNASLEGAEEPPAANEPKKGKESPKETPEAPPKEWDSATGPVLQVFLTSIATQ